MIAIRQFHGLAQSDFGRSQFAGPRYSSPRASLIFHGPGAQIFSETVDFHCM